MGMKTEDGTGCSRLHNNNYNTAIANRVHKTWPHGGMVEVVHVKQRMNASQQACACMAVVWMCSMFMDDANDFLGQQQIL